MEVLTIRVDPNTVEALDEEYSQYGYSNRAEYIRAILDDRERIRENTEENTLEERVDDLEARVAELEQRETPTVDGDQEDVGEPDPVDVGEPDPVDVDDRDRVDHSEDPLRERMRDALADVDVPGRKAAVEKTRRDAVMYAWERLREQGTAETQELANATFGAFWDDDDLGYSVSSRYPGYQLWDSAVRDALKQLPGVEAPGRRGNEYRFVEE